VVDVQDQFGNRVGSFQGVVTLALTGSAAGNALQGPVTATVVNGFARLSSLSITTAGTSNAITASTAGLTAAVTRSFVVVPAEAAQLVVASQPSGALLANQPLGITVTSLDRTGNLAASSDGTVSTALPASGGHGQIAGTLASDHRPSPARIRLRHGRLAGNAVEPRASSSGHHPRLTSVRSFGKGRR
jgi:hypothetical protein